MIPLTAIDRVLEITTTKAIPALVVKALVGVVVAQEGAMAAVVEEVPCSAKADRLLQRSR
jgi:hypothetical protein